jgi:hypothetical protein
MKPMTFHSTLIRPSLQATTIAFILTSCAWIGTRSSVYDAPPTKIKRVAVLLTDSEIIAGSEINGENFLFTKTIAEELKRQHLFYFIILDKKFSGKTLSEQESSTLARGLAGTYDGLLISRCYARRIDYKVELKLYSTVTGKPVISAKHNTTLGNSYWFPQPPHIVLQDATHGAVQALAHRWTKIQDSTFKVQNSRSGH